MSCPSVLPVCASQDDPDGMVVLFQQELFQQEAAQFDVEDKSLLQHLQEFEERMQARWAATEECLRQHEKRMEASVADLRAQFKVHAHSNAAPQAMQVDVKEVEQSANSEYLGEMCEDDISDSDGHLQQKSKQNDAQGFLREGGNNQQTSSRTDESRKRKHAANPAKAHLQNIQQASDEKLKKMHKKKQDLQEARQKRLQSQSAESLICTGTLAKEKIQKLRKAQTPLQRFVKHRNFDAFFGLLILSNAFLTGFETEYRASNLGTQVPLVYDLLNLIFCMAFLLELILRIFAFKFVFFYGKECSWNFFDLAVVSSSVIEELLKWTKQSSASGPNGITTVRVLRLLRLVRMTRVVRALRFMHELRVMVLSICGSFRPLLWTCALLLLLLFVNGVYITQVVNDYRSDPENVAWLPELEYYYGSVSTAVYSLFMSVSGGVDWGDVSEPLTAISSVFPVYFSFFIAVVVFTYLNVVTGIFVDNALKTAESDRDVMIQEEMSRRHAYAAEVEIVFREADSNGDGLLSYEELATHFADDRVGAWLGTLGIDSHAGHALFDMLDEDGQGFVDITDFVQGCFRLKGNARNIDVAMMQFEQRKLLNDLKNTFHIAHQRMLAAIEKHSVKESAGPACVECTTVNDFFSESQIMALPLVYSPKRKPPEPLVIYSPKKNPAASADIGQEHEMKPSEQLVVYSPKRKPPAPLPPLADVEKEHDVKPYESLVAYGPETELSTDDWQEHDMQRTGFNHDEATGMARIVSCDDVAIAGAVDEFFKNSKVINLPIVCSPKRKAHGDLGIEAHHDDVEIAGLRLDAVNARGPSQPSAALQDTANLFVAEQDVVIGGG
eukprot:gnl/MRDRNA2_/MRDRNA2_30055_c0_seq1.p1 gnl/MRDRNA2_/MRDRNA2_30055_c0~~gnl/MRDRNA2_/MRDRNA2_30055_c0_seq1.p1  ORF type:complete len:839 (+),score=177.60 gnl/MRDRNA2_/MRDRNA2_30055_c0_seq1:66-2582(+)